MVRLPTGADIVKFLGRTGDVVPLPRQQHVRLVTLFVRGYTRGRGFVEDGTEVEEDLGAVIVTATARLVTNPAQVERESVDRYSTVGAFQRVHTARVGRPTRLPQADRVRNTPHRIEVLRYEPVGVVDGEAVLSWSVFATVPGWFSFLDAEAWPGQTIEASARVPSWVDATREDRVRLVHAPPELAGQWIVETVRPGRDHTRLMLRRSA
jgi:hypothetical protein